MARFDLVLRIDRNRHCPAVSVPCAPLIVALALSGCGPSPSKSITASQPKTATAPPVVAPAQPRPTAEAQAPAVTSAEQQRVSDLIAQVEAAYAQGEADYRKGMLAEAKIQFDHAVDLMLSSGLDIRSNPQLSDEFDHIVDKVNGLEMEALKQGNGFVPQVEPTPAEEASDVTFAVDPNLVAKATADLATTKSDLPLMMNDYVAAFINFFAYSERGHNTLLHSFERAGRYRTMIQRIMAEEGVPQDLIYLAVAESGFQPRAIDRRSRAGGMWQFMPSGDYGLTRNRWVDERFDPEKSTRAYARYMKFLYNQLGDWYLAMAAYDWGAGNVQRAVEKTGYADFWELYKRHNLPAETQNYVPEILAAIIIANHPKQYGFEEVTLDPPVLTDTVTVNDSVSLNLVADLVGAPVDEIEALNPSLLETVTPPDISFDLHLPAGTATLFDQRIADIPESKRNAWRYHLVASGDTLASVAREFHVSPAALASANQLSESGGIEGVEALVVPVAPKLEPASRRLLYTVRRGDTLVTIADRFGVSLGELRRWNHLSGFRVEPGRRLHVTEPARLSEVASTAGHRRSSSTTHSGARTSTTKSTAASRQRGAKSKQRRPQSSRKVSSSEGRSAHKSAELAKSSEQK
jgi:membrane-bound lytic murein transglycosylase D